MSCLLILTMVTNLCLDVEPNLVMAVIRQESNFINKDVPTNESVGLMQILPSTARMIGCEAKTRKDLLIPEKNIKCGCRYLSLLKKKHKTNGALIAAYNAGDAFICRKGVKCKIGQYTNQVHVNKVLKWEKYEFCKL